MGEKGGGLVIFMSGKSIVGVRGKNQSMQKGTDFATKRSPFEITSHSNKCSGRSLSMSFYYFTEIV
jgi:hypothetical protein